MSLCVLVLAILANTRKDLHVSGIHFCAKRMVLYNNPHYKTIYKLYSTSTFKQKEYKLLCLTIDKT